MERFTLSSMSRQLVKFCVGKHHDKNYSVIPVFFPFSGCTSRCVFCAQVVQTGTPEGNPLAVLRHVDATVFARESAHNIPLALAFYGGTFTGLPEAVQRACMDWARAHAIGGKIVHLRCSTRPDMLSRLWLEQLRHAGMDLIELGIQSFSDAALHAAGRGYDGVCAHAGCTTVQEAQLELGIQLMPGMPGVSPDVFLADMEQALAHRPACLRLYPCLVLEGTELATMWRHGDYVPWDMPTAVRTLGTALAMAWAQEVPVIRMGLAPGPELQAAVLAGPWHPAFGSMVQGEALMQSVEKAAGGRRIHAVYLPRTCQGFAAGHRGALWPRWQALGVARAQVLWHDAPHGAVELESC